MPTHIKYASVFLVVWVISETVIEILGFGDANMRTNRFFAGCVGIAIGIIFSDLFLRRRVEIRYYVLVLFGIATTLSYSLLDYATTFTHPLLRSTPLLIGFLCSLLFRLWKISQENEKDA